jgi:hypothetical protein
MWDDKTLQEFDKWKKSRPETISHGLSNDDIMSHMKQLRPNAWHLKGNELIGDTDFGALVQRIPTNYILIGSDDEGLPIFRKIDI